MSEVTIGERILNVKSLPDESKEAGDVTVHLPKERIVVFPEGASQPSVE
jgi:hypothetical protein